MESVEEVKKKCKGKGKGFGNRYGFELNFVVKGSNLLLTLINKSRSLRFAAALFPAVY